MRQKKLGICGQIIKFLKIARNVYKFTGPICTNATVLVRERFYNNNIWNMPLEYLAFQSFHLKSLFLSNAAAAHC